MLRATRTGAALTARLSRLAGKDDRYSGCDDATLVVSAARWAAAEAHAAAGKAAALAELIRRSPSGQKLAAAGDMPACWEFGLAEQAALELAVSPGSADRSLHLAWTLQVRLPLTFAALRAGVLDGSKVHMIAEVTSVLSDQDAREAEAQLAERWEGKTWSQLHARLTRIVVNIDPEAAIKRREKAQREDARVRFWRETSGNAALAAYELPPDEALAAHARIQDRALAYKKAGLDGSMDLLRVRAFVDLLNGTDSRDCYQGGDGGDTLDDGGDGAADGGNEADEGPDGDGGTGGNGPGGNGNGPGGNNGNGPTGVSGDADSEGIAANLDLTLPLATLLNLAERAGEADQLGTVDPALVRSLAAAAVRSHKTTVRIIITGPDGRAVGFGIAKERKQRNTRRGSPPPTPAPPGTAEPDRPEGPAGQPSAPGFGFGPAPAQPSLPLGGLDKMSGWGTWRLAAAGREWDITIIPIPAPGPCGHEYRTAAHDPGEMLRSLVQIRDGQCSLPVCSHLARGSDWEHAIPWPEGETCAHNGGIHCRKDHRLKQHKNWKIVQLPDGRRRWTTPAGLTYLSQHRHYPD